MILHLLLYPTPTHPALTGSGDTMVDPAYFADTFMRAARRRERGEDAEDAIVDTVLPKVAEWFGRLFKEYAHDPDGLFEALNGLMLTLYRYSPDTFQLLVRFVANMGTERLQGRAPSWVSVPIMVFIKGYFNALEATSRDFGTASREEVRAALEHVRAQASNAYSDLSDKFNKASQSAASMDLPSPFATLMERIMSRSPPPDRSADDKSPTLRERAADVIEFVGGAWTAIREYSKEAADLGEDYVQIFVNNVVKALFFIALTIVLTAVAAVIPWSPVMGLNVFLWTAFWVVAPFAVFRSWRNAYREREQRTMTRGSNPYEQAGNGVIEGGMLALTLMFAGLVSPIVIASINLVASIVHFNRVYVWIGLITLGAGFFGFSALDWVVDGIKSLVGMATRDDKNTWLKFRNRGVRSYALLGYIYCFLATIPIFNYVWSHTDYLGSSFIAGCYLALVGVFVNARSGITASNEVDHNVNDLRGTYQRRDFSTARLLVFLGVFSMFCQFTFDTLVPPPHKAGSTEEYMSYAERGRAFLLPEKSNGCPDEISHFVAALQDVDTCTIVLDAGRPSDDAEAGGYDACNIAKECGALDTKGVRRSTLTERGGGSSLAGVLCMLIALVAGGSMFGLAIVGRKKKGGDGH